MDAHQVMTDCLCILLDSIADINPTKRQVEMDDNLRIWR